MPGIGLGGTVITDPSVFGMGGGNLGGTNVSVPGGSSTGDGSSLGGGSNPLMPTFPSGQNSSPPTSLMGGNFPANGAPGTGNVGGGTLSNTNIASLLGFGGVNGSWAPNQNQLISALGKAGFSAGDAGMLYNFLASGAGFNPGVAQMLISTMQPQIERGQQSILEQFGSMGLGGSSAAAIGMGDYLSQVNLNQEQILGSMYEQSVQNYLSVLMGGKGNPPPDMFQNLLAGISGLGSAASGTGSILSGLGSLNHG